MTDIYIAYAREDRERAQPLADMLREAGWDVWFDSAQPSQDHNPHSDVKMTRAGAILVAWSEHARKSEYVRSEAATGLYKNKLVQLRLDGTAPPRPFDQVDSLDISRWSGGQDGAEWRRLVTLLRNTAGEPVAPRQAQRRAPQPQPQPPPVRAPEPQAARAPEPPPAPQAQTLTFTHTYAQQATAAHAAAPPLYSPPPRAPDHGPRDELLRWAEQMEPMQQPAAQPQLRPVPPPPPPVARPAPPPPLPPQPQPITFDDQDDDFYMRPASTERAPAPVRMDWHEPPPVRRPEPDFSPPARVRHDRQERLPHSDLGISSDYGMRGNGGGWAGPALVVAAVMLIGSGAGLWFADPFGWRAGGGNEPVALAARAVPDAPIANSEPATGVPEDSAEADADWVRVDRKSPEALRDHIGAFPRASTSETARAALRVMDAQAWVKAVTSDNETAYRTYLASFPAGGAAPGAMATAANERLTQLGAERTQAIEEIQRGLAALDMYDGAVSGRVDEDTTEAVRRFAVSKRRQAPTLASAAPRDLRAFAESMRGSGVAAPKANAAVAAAAVADQQRMAQAQAASVAATKNADLLKNDDVDLLARTQQQRLAEREAWASAESANTVTAYQAYLTSWPNGTQAAAASAAITRLNKPAAFSVEQLSDDLKSAVEAARREQTIATQRASAARQAASSAEGAVDARSIVGAEGDRYDAQISNGAPNGFGVRVRGSGVNVGDRYRGELRNGRATGLGVYEYADNAGNASARGLRYEGEHSNDVASGYGVMHWRDGGSFAGMGAGGTGQSRGVLTYPNGLRYEGEMSGGQRHGLGVVWGADGNVVQAGRWTRDDLSEPMRRS